MWIKLQPPDFFLSFSPLCLLLTDKSSVGSEAQACWVFQAAAGSQWRWLAVVEEISQSGPSNGTIIELHHTHDTWMLCFLLLMFLFICGVCGRLLDLSVTSPGWHPTFLFSLSALVCHSSQVQLTCKDHLCDRSSAGGGNWVVGPPPPGKSRRVRLFFSSSHHTAYWYMDRTAHPGCTLQAHAPGSASGPGGTCAGCTGWSLAPFLCMQEHTLISENHTFRIGRSPAPPSGIDSHRPVAWKMRLKVLEKDRLVEHTATKGQFHAVTGLSLHHMTSGSKQIKRNINW